jgi:hypothetical protein
LPEGAEVSWRERGDRLATRLLVWLLVLLGVLSLLAIKWAADGLGASRPLFSQPARRGDTGKQVAAAQWVLQGNDPNVYRKAIHPLRGHPVTGQFGRRTARAVLAARWLLGEPVVYTKKCPDRTGKQATFGRRLYLILTGREARPVCWIGRASQRLKIFRTQRATRAPPWAQRVVDAAKHELALGIEELPPGSHSNNSPRIRQYEAATALRPCAVNAICTWWHWCVAFAQFVYQQAGIGTIADRTAGVKYAYAWAQRLGLVRARPVVGAWVSFLRNDGHQGIVIGVSRTGFSTIEGNCHDRVCSRSYPLNTYLTVFIVPPIRRGAH